MIKVAIFPLIFLLRIPVSFVYLCMWKKTRPINVFTQDVFWEDYSDIGKYYIIILGILSLILGNQDKIDTFLIFIWFLLMIWICFWKD